MKSRALGLFKGIAGVYVLQFIRSGQLFTRL
jgi:hypothetical protein